MLWGLKLEEQGKTSLEKNNMSRWRKNTGQFKNQLKSIIYAKGYEKKKIIYLLNDQCLKVFATSDKLIPTLKFSLLLD